MHTMKLKRAIALAVLLIVAGLALPHTRAARADDDNRAPELPAPCADLQVPPGHEVAFRVYAVGVQVYKWNGAGWDFDGPVASLFEGGAKAVPDKGGVVRYDDGLAAAGSWMHRYVYR